MLGAIPEFSGNLLFRQVLDGHPQIMLIEDYTVLNNELYYICIRLAEEKAGDVLSEFWKLYRKEMDVDTGYPTFFDKDKEKFNRKLETLLQMGENFTAQELFVMFHLAYEAMYGRELNLASTIIYWEPHGWHRECVREWAYWFSCKEVKTFTFNMVRNGYARAGSSLRYAVDLKWLSKMRSIYSYKCSRRALNENEYECFIRFEDLKCKSGEVLDSLCEWLGICFDHSLMDTTIHGERVFYDGSITGFDPKPAYNLYEQFFSVFDRTRICILNGSKHKENGYPYVGCTDFSRREIQEMFLKAFRWEQLPGGTEGKTEGSVWGVQKYFRSLLWRERFMEVMGTI